MLIVQGNIQHVLFGFLLYFGNYNPALGTDTCPSDYIMYNNYCYHFSNEKTNWNNAREICKSHGSSLSSIADSDEAMFLHRKIKTANFTSAQTRQDQWIGFYPTDDSDITAKDVKDRRVGWAWLDGSDVTWATWRENEPTLNDGCARLHEDDDELMLMGKECTQSYYYICKQETIGTSTSTPTTTTTQIATSTTTSATTPTTTTVKTTSTTTTPTTTQSTTIPGPTSTTTKSTTTNKSPPTTTSITPSRTGVTSDPMEYTTRDRASETAQDDNVHQVNHILRIVLIATSVIFTVLLVVIVILVINIYRIVRFKENLHPNK